MPEASGGLGGLDVDLVRAWAKERGHTLRFVRFRWPELSGAFRGDAFDLAVGGITVRPERSALGAFTRPVVVVGAIALVRDAGRFPDAAALAAARIAVHAGGHLEQVARERFPAAHLVAVADNREPPRLLAAGEVDAALTDSAEAPLWERAAPGAVRIGPLTRDAKAWWVRPDRPELARDLDRWLGEREADGTLARLRTATLAAGDLPRSAAPVPALLAALGERLSLQPLVAEAKRAAGLPVAAPAQEQRVLDAASAETREAAARRGRPAPPDGPVRALFRAQIDAGRALQVRALAGPPAGGPPFDLDRQLRPALARVGSRIAELVVELPRGTPRAELRRETEAWLALPGVPPESLRATADALADLGGGGPDPVR